MSAIPTNAVTAVAAGARAGEQARDDAARWLASLPSRTFIRRRATGRPHSRLVMYRTGASSPEFWEKSWLVSPPYRMRGYTLPAWYRRQFRKWLPRHGLIVEAGCGNGNLLRMLVNDDPERWGNFAGVADRGACVEGLDFAGATIEANQRIHPEGRYRVGDVRALPYRDAELSGYISMGVVEHFEDGERAVILNEAARCLRPGGTAVITVPSFSVARRLKAMCRGYPEECPSGTGHGESDGLQFYQFYFQRREIARQIEATGLKVVAIDGYDCRHGFIDAFGGRRTLDRFEKLGKRWAALVDHPPRVVRRFCPHMLMLIARKPA